MAPFEFENKLKEKLREREIKPSEEAWSKIDARLGPEKTPRKRPTPWIYLAAAVIVLFLGIRWAMQDASKGLEAPEVVASPTKEVNTATPDPKEDVRIVPATEFNEAPLPVVAASLEKADRSEAQELAVQEDIGRETQPDPQAIKALDTMGLEQKITEQLDAMLARVTELESNREALADAQIDSLLREAQEQILQSRFAVPADSVDALALLQEAELELDQSFRESLLERLKDGFSQVRLAMAERNN